MKTSAQFNIDISEKYGVEASIVWELLDSFCRIQRAMDKQKMYRNEEWWCKCPDAVFEILIPYIKEKKRKSILEKLLANEVIAIQDDEYTTHLPNEDTKKKEKKIVVKKTESEDRIYSFNRVENGQMKRYDVAGSKLIAMLIEQFKYINPDYEKFYGHPSQRKALSEMIDQYQPEILFNLLAVIPQTNKQQYAPVILTPQQFKSKAASLIIFIQREGNNNSTGFVM